MVQAVPGYARFEVGERVVLFLERTMTGRLVVTGLSQGKFLLQKAESGWIAVQALGDIHHPTNHGVADTFGGSATSRYAYAFGAAKAIIAGRTLIERRCF